MASIKKVTKSTNLPEFDRVPPQSLDAEAAVLGSMMIDNDCIGRVVEILEPSHFYRTSHKKIFSAKISQTIQIF